MRELILCCVARDWTAPRPDLTSAFAHRRSFPAKKDRQNQLAHEETLRKIEKLKTDLQEAEAKLADAKRGREDDEEGTRAKKMQRRSELKREIDGANAELSKLKQNDPQAIADLEKELKFVKEAADRWTDNIFSCKDYLVKKRGMMKKEANKYLGITDNFDCKWEALDSVSVRKCC